MHAPYPIPAPPPRGPLAETGETDASPRPDSPPAFDRLYIAHPRRWLVALIAAYLIVGAYFAYATPPWQAPDEPAHYNYIAHIAKTGSLPVLQMGDFDLQRINILLDTRFPRKLTTAGLRYESYQPPLYYILATPVYWLSQGSLLAIRLFGVALGAVTLLLLYACLTVVFPGKSLIPLGATAFSALLPMHAAMNAAANNDGAAELLLMVTMLLLLRWMRRAFYDEPATPAAHRRRLLWLGVSLGLGMVTKIYAYLLLPIVLTVVLLVAWLRPRLVEGHGEAVQIAPRRATLWAGLRGVGWVILPAIGIALPMWVRNALLYGPTDLLAMRWHDDVVVGQVRTADWIAANGWIAFGERAFSLTFKSFWGVFGWMGVFMDERIYTALLLFSGVIFMGILWALVRFVSGGTDTDMDMFQLSVLILFGVILLAVVVGYLGYNAKFMQHQGRYFFWGLLPISALVALGWREVLQPLQGAITGFLAAVLAVATALSATVTGDLNKWTLLSITSIALVLLAQPLLLGGDPNALRWLPAGLKDFMARPWPARLLQAGRAAVWVLPFVLLLLLNLTVPTAYIIPQLARR